MILPCRTAASLFRPACGNLPVTRDRVEARTRELALLAGRPIHQVTRTDYQRAKREITGECQPHRQDRLLDSPAFWRPDPARS